MENYFRPVQTYPSTLFPSASYPATRNFRAGRLPFLMAVGSDGARFPPFGTETNGSLGHGSSKLAPPGRQWWGEAPDDRGNRSITTVREDARPTVNRKPYHYQMTGTIDWKKILRILAPANGPFAVCFYLSISTSCLLTCASFFLSSHESNRCHRPDSNLICRPQCRARLTLDRRHGVTEGRGESVRG
jgi:hypothetical protein